MEIHIHLHSESTGTHVAVDWERRVADGQCTDVCPEESETLEETLSVIISSRTRASALEEQ